MQLPLRLSANFYSLEPLVNKISFKQIATSVRISICNFEDVNHVVLIQKVYKLSQGKQLRERQKSISAS